MALALPLFFGFAAVVVDGSTLMAQRRALQNAADAAALAGAQALPATGPCLGPYTDPSTCQARVLAIVTHYSEDLNNGPTVDHPCVDTPTTKDINCYTNPYKGSDQLLEVRLRKPSSTFFSGVIGLGNLFDIAGRAVASALAQTGTLTTVQPGSTGTNITPEIVSTNYSTLYSTSVATTTVNAVNDLVYTKSTGCTSLKISGQENIFHGALESNGGFDIAFDNDGDYLGWSGVDPSHCFKLHDGLPPGDGTYHPRWKTVTSPAHTDFPVDPPTYSPSSGAFGTVSWIDQTGTTTTVPCTGTAPTQVKPATHPVALAASPNGATEAPLPSHTVTLTTSVANGFSGWTVGDSITVANVANTNYNGTFTITGVPSSTQITYTSTRSNLPASGGGTVLNNNPAAPALPPGLYCLNNVINITQDVVLQNVGFAGTKISVATNVTLDHGYVGPPTLFPDSYHGLLMLATDNGSNAVQMSGANIHWTGTIFAEFGKATISGAGTVVGSPDIYGFIEANEVQFSGCCATWYGLGPFSGGTPGTTTTVIPTNTVTTPTTIFTATTDYTTYTGSTQTDTVITGTTIGMDE